MNRSKIVALLIAAAFTLVGVRADDAAAKAPKLKPQTTCPVMGGKIDKKLYADVDGKRIYVCCPGCIATIKKDPAKYIKKLEDQGVAIAKLQTTCPVMGGKINKKLYADVDGKRIYVCCPGCIAAIKKDPEKYLKKLKSEGVVLEDTPTAAEK
jgi:YHS domain-containing protein